jgi:sec-independent protein translocase protein TatA
MTLLLIGTQELLLIGLVIVLLFGGKKIPELMRGLGKGVRSFKEGMNGVDEPGKEVRNDAKEATHANPSEKPAATNDADTTQEHATTES